MFIKKRSTLPWILMIFLAGFSTGNASSMLAPPEVLISPPTHTPHSIKIERHGKTEKEKRLIAMAETVQPKATSWSGLSPKEFENLQGRLFAPFAITKDTINFYTERIEGYRKTTFSLVKDTPGRISEGNELGSHLIYTAKIQHLDGYSNEGKVIHNAYLVKLELSFEAKRVEGGPFLDTVCGFPQTLSFTKKRSLILDSTGSLLSIDGDKESHIEIKGMGKKGHFGSGYENTAHGLAHLDPQQATIWAQSIPDPGLREKALSKIEPIHRRVHNAAEQAKSWAQNYITPSSHQFRSSGHQGYRGHQMTVGVSYQCQEYSVAKNWAAIAPRDAAQWALSIQDDLLRNSALQAVAMSWSRRYPEAMGAWYQKHVHPSKSSDLFITDVITRQAESSPGMVVQLLPYLQNKVLEEILKKNITDRWAYKQPGLAGNLALRIEDPKERVRLLCHIANIWSYHGNADNAKAWAQQVPDQRERELVLKAIVKRN